MCFPAVVIYFILYSLISIVPAAVLLGSHFLTRYDPGLLITQIFTLRLAFSFVGAHLLNAIACIAFPSLGLLFRGLLFGLLSAFLFFVGSSFCAGYFQSILCILAPIALLIQTLQLLGLT